MKNFLSTLFFCLAAITFAPSQSIDYQWVNTFGSSFKGFSTGQGIGVDASGSVYVAGFFSGTEDLDYGTGTTLIASATGSENGFLAKYTATGTLQWGGAVNSSYDCRIKASATDAAGNTFVAGTMAGTADFDIGIGFNTLQAFGRDIFIARYDASGNLAWAIDLPSTSFNPGSETDVLDLHLDAAGNILISGFIGTPVDFDPTPAVALRTPTSTNEAYIAKYDGTGALVFATILPGSVGGRTKPLGITTDPIGNVYICGTLQGTTDMDPGPGTANLSSAGPVGDAFLAKFASTGAHLWSFRVGHSLSVTRFNEIALDNANNPIIIGDFSNSGVDFDPSGSTFLLNSLQGSSYVARYSSAGTFSSVTQVGYTNNGDAFPTDIKVDATGNILLVGTFLGTTDLDPGAGSFLVTGSSGNNSIFLAKYNSSLAFQWGLGINSTTSSFANAMALSNTGSPHITGALGAIADFDPSSNVANVGTASTFPTFAAKYDANTGAYAWADAHSIIPNSATLSGSEEVTAITVDVSGNVFTGGTFDGTFDFDPGPGFAFRTSVGQKDVFITKHNAVGQFLWVATVGGNYEITLADMASDANGNLFVTGSFTDSADLNPGLGVALLVSAGQKDIYLLKLGLNGGLSQVENIVSGPGQEIAKSITVDATGQVFLTGSFGTSADFMPGNGTYVLPANGGASGFLAKYSNNCNHLNTWAIDGSTAAESISKVAIDPLGKIWLAGHASSPDIDLDPSGAVVNPVWTGNTNAFVARYEPTGSLLSHFSISGPAGNLTVNAFDIDDWGNLMIAGEHSNSIDFDPGPATMTMPLTGLVQGYIAKYTPSGALRWARPIGGAGYHYASGLSINPDGSAMVSGRAFTEIDLDPGPGSQLVSGLYGFDAYLIRLDSAGTLAGSMLLRSIGNDQITDVQSTGTNGLLIGGSFGCQLDFDPGPTIQNRFPNSANDAFVAKYTFPCVTPQLTLVSQTIPTCFGGNNGTAMTSVIGGNGFSYAWSPAGGNGPTATNLSAGSYQCIVTNSCGATDTLLVTIAQPNPINTQLLVNACDAYTWPLNGQTYTSSGSHNINYTSSQGCDSVVTLVLTIRQSTAATHFVLSCGPYTWPANGQTYSSTGTATTTLTNAAGCDSILTLDLTVRQSTTATLSQTACSSITINGQTFTSSGTYVQTLTNSAGCDSTLTLLLNIVQPSASSFALTECDSYTHNGITYTSSGTYTQTLTNSQGCDSVLTIFLNIQSITATVTVNGGTLTAFPSGSIYQWIDCASGTTIPGAFNQSFTPSSSGNYAVIVQDIVCTDTSSCESVVGIDHPWAMGLSIHPNPAAEQIIAQFNSTATSPYSLRIFDSEGKLILQFPNLSANYQVAIDIRSLAAGPYLVQAIQEGHLAIDRFLKR